MKNESTEVLIAVLYKAGLKIVNDTEFGKVLAKAADNCAIFQAFKTGSQYECSQVLEDKLDELVYEGVIGERIYQSYFKITSKLAEKFNEIDLESLDSAVREAIEKTANLIREKCVVSCC